MGAKQFGARVPRLEDPTLLTGRGHFVDDIVVPGVLSACFVRSPHGHARIRSIDTGAARAMPGVHAVLTADDLPHRIATGQIPMLVPNPAIKTPRTQIALARDEVCYVGQTVAVVIADSRSLAEDAAAASQDRLRDSSSGERRARRGEIRRGPGAFRSGLERRGLRADGLRRPRRGVQERRPCVRGGDGAAPWRRNDARRSRRAGELRPRRRHADGVVLDADSAPLPCGTLADLLERNLRSDPGDRAVRRRRLRAPRRRSIPRRR